jgi:hypothetical protein
VCVCVRASVCECASVCVRRATLILFTLNNLGSAFLVCDRLCGLVVRVLNYRSRGPGFDSRALQKKSNGSGTLSTQPRECN